MVMSKENGSAHTTVSSVGALSPSACDASPSVTGLSPNRVELLSLG